MHVKLLVLIIALCFVVDLAQAQRGARARKLTTAEIEKVVQMVSADNAKMQIYCEISKLNEQIGQAKATDSTTVETLERRVDELEDKIGPEFVKFVDALDDVDENSPEGKELMFALDKLDDLCRGK